MRAGAEKEEIKWNKQDKKHKRRSVVTVLNAAGSQSCRDGRIFGCSNWMWPHAEVTGSLQVTPRFPERESQGLTPAEPAARCLWVTSTSLCPGTVRRVRGLRWSAPRGVGTGAATPWARIPQQDPNRFVIKTHN